MLKKHPYLVKFLFVQACYLVISVFVFFVLNYLGLCKTFPTSDNLLNWDASWYKSIVDKGYIHHWYEASNTAFFPLFPLMWKIFYLNTIGVCVLNYMLFAIGLFLLYINYNIRRTTLLLLVSLPSCIFFFLPYTESLFFLCGSIFLVGLKRENNYYVVVGLLLCSLTRATAMFFIPSIIVMQLFHSNSLIDKKTWKNIIVYSLASAIGFFTVVFYQYSMTGVWFGFAKQQVRYWLHRFSFPGFPIISHGYDNVLWLDGLSFFVGVIASVLLFYYGIRFLIKKLNVQYSRAYWFSITYIFMLTVYSLFFNAKSFEGSTMILSMNRYLFATPFFFIFFSETFERIKFNKTTFTFFFISALLSWILMGLGGKVQFVDLMYKSQLRSGIFFSFMTLYLLLYLLAQHKIYGKQVSGILIFLNVFLSCLLFHTFISAKWVA